jgi:hypothetical protein
VAIDDLKDGEPDNPVFLDRLRAGAAAFPLDEGERAVIELPLTAR